MAKPILHYVLARGGLYKYHGFTVLGVTSEAHGQVHGRTVPGDLLTHVPQRDVIYRFPDGTEPQFAMDGSKRADAERMRHAAGIAQAEETVTRLRKARDLAVLDAAKGLGGMAWRDDGGRQPIRCGACGKTSGDDRSQCRDHADCILGPLPAEPERCDACGSLSGQQCFAHSGMPCGRFA